MSLDVVGLLRELIRVDTRNPGSSDLPAARLVQERLRQHGIASEIVEAAPGQVSVVSRVAGSRREGGLLVHAHLDTVAPGEGWSRDPLAGDIADGCVWGRGALDMKHAVAMMVAAQVELARRGGANRDVIFAYLADEETGGAEGARALVDRRPDLFTGVTDAIGEVGGYVVDGRAYLQRGEKGVLWARLRAKGSGGHGAFSDPSATPVMRLTRALATLPPTATPADDDEHQGPAWLRRLQSLGERTSFVATQLVGRSGAPNVVAADATLDLDVRTAPGDHADAREQLYEAAAAAGAEVELLRDDEGYAVDANGALPEVVGRTLTAVLGETDVVPFVLPAATDGRHFARLGIRCYGFVPLPLTEDFDPLSLMHAPDERIPLDSVRGGAQLLSDLVAAW